MLRSSQKAADTLLESLLASLGHNGPEDPAARCTDAPSAAGHVLESSAASAGSEEDKLAEEVALAVESFSLEEDEEDEPREYVGVLGGRTDYPSERRSAVSDIHHEDCASSSRQSEDSPHRRQDAFDASQPTAHKGASRIDDTSGAQVVPGKGKDMEEARSHKANLWGAMQRAREVSERVERNLALDDADMYPRPTSGAHGDQDRDQNVLVAFALEAVGQECVQFDAQVGLASNTVLRRERPPQEAGGDTLASVTQDDSRERSADTSSDDRDTEYLPGPSSMSSAGANATVDGGGGLSVDTSAAALEHSAVQHSERSADSSPAGTGVSITGNGSSVSESPSSTSTWSPMNIAAPGADGRALQTDRITNDAVALVKRSMVDENERCKQQLSLLRLQQDTIEERAEVELQSIRSEMARVRRTVRESREPLGKALEALDKREHQVRERLAAEKSHIAKQRADIRRERDLQRQHIRAQSDALLNLRQQTFALQGEGTFVRGEDADGSCAAEDEAQGSGSKCSVEDGQVIDQHGEGMADVAGDQVQAEHDLHASDDSILLNDLYFAARDPGAVPGTPASMVGSESGAVAAVESLHRDKSSCSSPALSSTTPQHSASLYPSHGATPSEVSNLHGGNRGMSVDSTGSSRNHSGSPSPSPSPPARARTRYLPSSPSKSETRSPNGIVGGKGRSESSPAASPFPSPSPKKSPARSKTTSARPSASRSPAADRMSLAPWPQASWPPKASPSASGRPQTSTSHLSPSTSPGASRTYSPSRTEKDALLAASPKRLGGQKIQTSRSPGPSTGGSRRPAAQGGDEPGPVRSPKKESPIVCKVDVLPTVMNDGSDSVDQAQSPEGSHVGSCAGSSFSSRTNAPLDRSPKPDGVSNKNALIRAWATEMKPLEVESGALKDVAEGQKSKATAHETALSIIAGQNPGYSAVLVVSRPRSALECVGCQMSKVAEQDVSGFCPDSVLQLIMMVASEQAGAEDSGGAASPSAEVSSGAGNAGDRDSFAKYGAARSAVAMGLRTDSGDDALVQVSSAVALLAQAGPAVSALAGLQDAIRAGLKHPRPRSVIDCIAAQMDSVKVSTSALQMVRKVIADEDVKLPVSLACSPAKSGVGPSPCPSKMTHDDDLLTKSTLSKHLQTSSPSSESAGDRLRPEEEGQGDGKFAVADDDSHDDSEPPGSGEAKPSVDALEDGSDVSQENVDESGNGEESGGSDSWGLEEEGENFVEAQDMEEEMDDELMANYWGPQDEDAGLIPDEESECSDDNLVSSDNLGESAAELAAVESAGQGASKESVADPLDMRTAEVEEEIEDDIKVN